MVMTLCALYVHIINTLLVNQIKSKKKHVSHIFVSSIVNVNVYCINVDKLKLPAFIFKYRVITTSIYIAFHFIEMVEGPLGESSVHWTVVEGGLVSG